MNINDAIDEFLTSKLMAQCRPSTIRSYSRTLTSLAAFCGNTTAMEAITPQLMRSFLIDAGTTLKASSINNMRRVLLCFLRFCDNEQITTPSNWAGRIPKVRVDKTEPRHLSEDECMRLISAVDINRRGYPLLAARDKAIVLMLLDTGMRRAECCSMKLSDMDTVTRTVHIRMAKSRRSRVVFYGEKTENALKRYLRLRKNYLGDRECDSVWITRTRSQLSPVELYDIVQDLARIARLPHLCVHSLRHTCATLLLRNGYPLAYVQAVLGHSVPAITQKYTHLASSDLQSRYSLASPVDNL